MAKPHYVPIQAFKALTRELNVDEPTFTTGPRSMNIGFTQGVDGAPVSSALSKDQQAYLKNVLEYISDVCGLTFNYPKDPGNTANSGVVRFTELNTLDINIAVRNDDGMAAGLAGVGGGNYYGEWDGDGHVPASTVNDYRGYLRLHQNASSATPAESADQTHVILHEFLHSIGFSHASKYDAADAVFPTYATRADYAEDNQQYTIMSYFAPEKARADGITGDYGSGVSHRPVTPMYHDIFALQRLFGANETTRLGNDTYGFNSTITDRGVFSLTATSPIPIFTIYDRGGTDRLDFSGYAFNATIDLNAGSFSSVGGRVSNIFIYPGVRIEQAVGGSGADVLIGNDFANLLEGGFGSDTLIGGGGADTLVGHIGEDVIDARGRGADTVDLFTSSKDKVLGDFQDNIILRRLISHDGWLFDFRTGVGSDGFEAKGFGRYSFQGGGSDETIYGSARGDGITLGWGDDKAFGRSGSDTLDGDAGDDELHGGKQNDVIVGGTGFDRLFGDDGGDLITFNAGGGDRIDGGAGLDTVQILRSTGLPDWRLVISETPYMPSPRSTLVATDNEKLKITGVEIFKVSSSGGNDEIVGSYGDDEIMGGAGADTITAGSGADTIVGGAGNDRVIIDPRAALDGRQDLVFGDDAFGAAAGSDTLSLILPRGSGNFYFDYATATGRSSEFGPVTFKAVGFEQIEVRFGLDVWTVGPVLPGHSNYTVLGAAGGDVMTTGGGNDVLQGRAGFDRLTAGAGNDVLDGGEDGDQLLGEAGADTIFGGGGGDTIDGGADADRMTGWLGDDTYFVDNSGDRVFEEVGAGRDTIVTTLSSIALGPKFVGGVSNVEDLIYSGAGDFSGFGSEVANLIHTGNGNDLLFGNGGDDSIDAGFGDDTVFGGLGADEITVWASGGDSIVADEVANEEPGSLDRLEVYRADGLANWRFDISTGVGSDGFRAQGFGRVAYYGSDGRDTVIGGNAPDTIFGGSNNDVITAFSGDDLLSGGLGVDTLTGGAGRDHFVFRDEGGGLSDLKAGNIDVITDFDLFSDRIELSTLLFKGDVTDGETLRKAQFQLGPKALEADDRFIYDPATGALVYDADGSGGGQALAIATLSPGLQLSAGNLFGVVM